MVALVAFLTGPVEQPSLIKLVSLIAASAIKDSRHLPGSWIIQTSEEKRSLSDKLYARRRDFGISNDFPRVRTSAHVTSLEVDLSNSAASSVVLSKALEA